ncbi:50S ribosomal protein L23 [Thermodesulfobacteriota bacterium]
MRSIYDVIKYPIITEKSNYQKSEMNQLTFCVDRRANKIEIKGAVEKLFKVKVIEVRTSNMKGKVKRVGRNIGKRPDWKKAIVTLRQGDHIDFFEGI